MPRGRPSTYTPELVAKICSHIAEGKSLRTICAMKGMPAMSTIFKWIAEHPDFSKQYAHAKEEQAEALVEDMLSIPDTEEDVQRARLKVDTRKWIASKLKAKKYGDRTAIVGNEDEPITVKDTTDIKDRVLKHLTDEQLKAIIAGNNES